MKYLHGLDWNVCEIFIDYGNFIYESITLKNINLFPTFQMILDELSGISLEIKYIQQSIPGKIEGIFLKELEETPCDIFELWNLHENMKNTLFYSDSLRIVLESSIEQVFYELGCAGDVEKFSKKWSFYHKKTGVDNPRIKKYYKLLVFKRVHILLTDPTTQKKFLKLIKKFEDGEDAENVDVIRMMFGASEINDKKNVNYWLKMIAFNDFNFDAIETLINSIKKF